MGMAYQNPGMEYVRLGKRGKREPGGVRNTGGFKETIQTKIRKVTSLKRIRISFYQILPHRYRFHCIKYTYNYLLCILR